MTPADEATAQREREWAQTEIGRLFYAYDTASEKACMSRVALNFNFFASAADDERVKSQSIAAAAARAAFLIALRGF